MEMEEKRAEEEERDEGVRRRGIKILETRVENERIFSWKTKRCV